MPIPAATIQRYQRGGDIYNRLAGEYGTPTADMLAAAAATGERANLTEALARVKYGTPLNESTGSILAQQLINDPLAAPLDALDSAVNKVFDSSGVKTILMIGLLALVVVVAVKTS